MQRVICLLIVDGTRRWWVFAGQDGNVRKIIRGQTADAFIDTRNRWIKKYGIPKHFHVCPEVHSMAEAAATLAELDPKPREIDK